MSDQTINPYPLLQRPVTNDSDAWLLYWKSQGQTWRTEPEIDPERQKYLAERRSIKPDSEKGIYPFKGVKLSRADIEWLIATSEFGREQIEMIDGDQHGHEELDLREVDLSGLTLTKVNLKKANLYMANLEGAKLNSVDLQEANLRRANLVGAHLDSADLGQASLDNANLEQAFLLSANLEGADFSGVPT